MKKNKTHTKRKFIGNIRTDFSINELKGDVNHKNLGQIDFEKYSKIFVHSDDNTIIQGFIYLLNGKPIGIPEPEPSILFFTNAESKLEEIVQLQKTILDSKFSLQEFSKLSHVFYKFFQLSTDYVVNLFMSIEAFNNSLFPDNFSIKIKRKYYNKASAQRYMRFSDKMEMAIPRIIGASFVLKYPHKYELIENLKGIRDDVIHTKKLTNGYPASYKDIYVKFLETDYPELYNVVMDYFNYYKTGLVEECDCTLV